MEDGAEIISGPKTESSVTEPTTSSASSPILNDQANNNNTTHEDHQSYFNWVDPEKIGEGGVTIPEIIEALKYRYEHLRKYTDISLKYNCTELIGDQGSLAYILALTKDFHGANLVFLEGKNFIKLCTKKEFIGSDYLDGFNYVFDCLEMHIYCMESKLKENYSPIVDWESIPKFDQLKPKTQATVLALKYYFYKQLRTNLKDKLLIAEKMIELDSEHYDWYLIKATILRYIRQNKLKSQTEKCDKEDFEEEIAAIELAKFLSPNHPFCCMDYCQLIAEMGKRLKQAPEDWETEPLHCGSQEFVYDDEWGNFLKDECKKCLHLHRESVRINYTIADIFLNWLPRRYRDMKFIEICLQRAWALHRTSSEGNYRLATFYMSIYKMEKAEEYCSLAVKYDPRNIAASTNLVLILLGNPTRNEAKLTQIFDSLLKGPVVPLNREQKANLCLYAGIFLHLMSGHETEATKYWRKAYELGKNPNLFDVIFKSCHARYNWPPGHVTISEIRKTVKSAKKKDSSIENNTKYEKLEEILKQSEQEEAEFVKICRRLSKRTSYLRN